MLSDQPADKLHSQLDHSPHSRATKIKGRQPITLHPDDAAARGIADGDLLRVFNDRGACLAAARLSDRIRRGVVRLSTGAWFDPADAGSNRPLEKHGNPNALTLDIGASKLSQGCIAQTCLVEIERFDGPAPAGDRPSPAASCGAKRYLKRDNLMHSPAATALSRASPRPILSAMARLLVSRSTTVRKVCRVGLAATVAE